MVLLNPNPAKKVKLPKDLSALMGIPYCDIIFDKFALGDETGCERFRRLRLLGFV